MIEKESEKDLLQRNWCGRYSFHCLIHALMDNDDVKHAFFFQLDIPSDCLAIESHKSKDHNPIVWKMIAKLWNNLEFTPLTE